MTERDSDIEFDFFDEPETEEATERVRTPRRPPPGGPRRPVRTPQGLIPMLRLAGLIAFLILAAVLLVVGIRSCASSSKHDRYDAYLKDVATDASGRAQVRLSAGEREHLQALIRKGKSPAKRLLKARILLKADVSEAGEGWSDSWIIQALDTSASMIYRVRKQLVEEGSNRC